MQQNLEQIRAAAADKAIKANPTLSKAAVSKLPALILQNGMLATAAFCSAEGGGENRGHLKIAMECAASHLADRGLLSEGIGAIQDMIADLCKRDSHDLQRATEEALEYIAYLKRFAPKA